MGLLMIHRHILYARLRYRQLGTTLSTTAESLMYWAVPTFSRGKGAKSSGVVRAMAQ